VLKGGKERGRGKEGKGVKGGKEEEGGRKGRGRERRMEGMTRLPVLQCWQLCMWWSETAVVNTSQVKSKYIY